jgi:hypothetical protein
LAEVVAYENLAFLLQFPVGYTPLFTVI